MTILVSKATVQDINAALIRLKKTLETEQSNFETRVNNVLASSSATSSGLYYDDTELRELINSLQTQLSNLGDTVSGNRLDINTLFSMLANFNVDYQEPNLIITDYEGYKTYIPIKDTTYTFSYETTSNTITVTNDLSQETFTFTGSYRYSFVWSNGTLYIKESSNGGSYTDLVSINLDNRYYTETEIDSLLRDIKSRIQALETAGFATETYVNRQIATATATFRGTFESQSEMNQTTGDLNDYAYVHGNNTYDRYKWTDDGWEYEYSLSFTSLSFDTNQWAAINSCITNQMVCKITDVYNCKVSVYEGTTCKGSFTLNQNCNSSVCLSAVNNSCITICQGNTCKGSFTLNQSSGATICLEGAKVVCQTASDILPLLVRSSDTCFCYNSVCANAFCGYVYGHRYYVQSKKSDGTQQVVGYLPIVVNTLLSCSFASGYCPNCASCCITLSCFLKNLEQYLEQSQNWPGPEYSYTSVWDNAHSVYVYGPFGNQLFSGASVKLVSDSSNQGSSFWNCSSGWATRIYEIRPTASSRSYTIRACRGSSSAVYPTVGEIREDFIDTCGVTLIRCSNDIWRYDLSNACCTGCVCNVVTTPYLLSNACTGSRLGCSYCFYSPFTNYGYTKPTYCLTSSDLNSLRAELCTYTGHEITSSCPATLDQLAYVIDNHYTDKLLGSYCLHVPEIDRLYICYNNSGGYTCTCLSGGYFELVNQDVQTNGSNFWCSCAGWEHKHFRVGLRSVTLDFMMRRGSSSAVKPTLHMNSYKPHMSCAALSVVTNQTVANNTYYPILTGISTACRGEPYVCSRFRFRSTSDYTSASLLNLCAIEDTVQGFGYRTDATGSGYGTLFLLYDITKWATCPSGTYNSGINGTLYLYRTGGYALQNQIDVIANVAYTKCLGGNTFCNGNGIRLYYSSLNREYCSVPVVVCCGSCYYLALCSKGMNAYASFNGLMCGSFLGCTICLSADSSLPSGWCLLATGTSCDKVSYVNNTTANSNLPLTLVADVNSCYGTLNCNSCLTYNPSSCTLTVPNINTHLCCVVRSCALPYNSSKCYFVQVCVADIRSSVEQDIYITHYNRRYLLNLTGKAYSYGDTYSNISYSLCSYSCSCCNCFWLRLSPSYRWAVMCSAYDFKILCCTTTDPGCTWTDFTDGNCCSVYNNSNNNYDLALAPYHGTSSYCNAKYYTNNKIYANPSIGTLYVSCLEALHGNEKVCINPSCGCGLIIQGCTGCDRGLFIGSSTCCYNIGMEIGAGNVNRGFYHRTGTNFDTFQWLLYWNASCEVHNCPIYSSCQITAVGCICSCNGIQAAHYKTAECCVTYSFPANSCTYILLGCYQNAMYCNDICLTYSVGGGSQVETGSLHIIPTGAQCAAQGSAAIDIRQSRYNATLYGIHSVVFQSNGTGWNCYTKVYLKVYNAGSSACSWRVSLYRNQVNGTWNTCFSCIGSTAPTGCCSLEVSRPTVCACNWEWSNSYKEAVPQYNCVCSASVSLGSCCLKTLVICTTNCNVYKKMLISVCSSCASTYRSVLYVNVVKNGACNTYNINACFGSANCDIIMPYRIGACGGNVYIDFASCSGATLLANVSVRSDNNAQGITCKQTVSVCGMSWQDLCNCNWPTSVQANVSCNGQTLANVLSANVITACCIASTSSLKLKCDIVPHTGCALCLLKDVCIYDYRYKTDKCDSIKRIGTIADWTTPVLSGEKQDHFDLSNAVGLLIKATQELNDRYERKWYIRLIKRIRNRHGNKK